MPVTFPRGMPPFNLRSGTIALERMVVGNPLRGGQVERVEVGEPRWTVSYTSVPLTRAQTRAAEAWWESLAGGVRTFLAVPPGGAFPSTYPGGFAGLTRSGGGAFDGTSRLDAFGATNDLLTFGTTGFALPAGFVLAAGDYIGLSYQNRVSLHRVIEAQTASGAGQITQIQVTPFVRPTLFPAGNLVTITMYNPAFEAVITSDSWSCETQIDFSTASFSAIQRGY